MDRAEHAVLVLVIAVAIIGIGIAITSEPNKTSITQFINTQELQIPSTYTIPETTCTCRVHTSILYQCSSELSHLFNVANQQFASTTCPDNCQQWCEQTWKEQTTNEAKDYQQHIKSFYGTYGKQNCPLLVNVTTIQGTCQ
ncbi:hypothetical protein COV18_01355 [Candidatus Woesearchaeota archaeon CG10_big_fil_rev_8_21_14_0_10_37_12]|nr:MAG: hypothetical protein COV18_01355 [Candidatus Woesearchaeota archaeon CG10_big_fil_rev_8_21_14_0_10_37_12]